MVKYLDYEGLQKYDAKIKELINSQSGDVDGVSYGIEFDTTVSSPTCTRIGNITMHRTLPVQSMMRGCLLDDDGNVVKYLDEADWTSETRDGSEGQVMVEIPEHYRMFETDGTKRRVRISTTEFSGSHKVPKVYVSAYEAALDRTNDKLASVVNTTAQYRGGNNTSSWDDTYRSLLGMPATYYTRSKFRNYARRRNSASTEWNINVQDVHKTIFWLFVVEYATLNMQANYTAELTTDGYHQGGLGAGVTTISGSSWTSLNSGNPIVPCGASDSLGNGTGVVTYNVLNSSGSTVYAAPVPRYRGIENIFGHIHKYTDGYNLVKTSSGWTAYTCSDPTYFDDSTSYYTEIGGLTVSSGYITKILFGDTGEILPTATGGSSSTYFCDYVVNATGFYTGTMAAMAYGGDAHNDTSCGPLMFRTDFTTSTTNSGAGTRLCFIPNE